MTVSRHEYSLDVVGASYRVALSSGEVTLDESWSPYVQASVTIPLPPPHVLAALDPRADARCYLSMSVAYGTSETLSTLSTSWAGGTLAAWTSDLAGQSLSDWSVQYGQPYNADDRAPSRRTMALGVRSRVINYETATVRIDLASDEMLLQDLALVATSPVQPGGATVRHAVGLVLSRIGAALVPGGADAPLEVDAAAWTPGQSAWDYLRPLVDAAGLRLYCDELRLWHLVEPLSPVAGSLSLDESTLTLLEESVSRDEGWYDAVIITYRWRDSSDVDRVRYDSAITAGYSRVLALEYERPWPGAGAARAILARARGRGRIEAATTVSDYRATPGQVLTVTTSTTPIQSGLVTRVSWDMDSDEMQIRSRDLTDTPRSAWVLIPSGISWDAIPAGMSWPALEFQEV